MIVIAAVKRGNRIWIGKRHSDCFDRMRADGCIFFAPGTAIQGFLTHNAKFVDREQAYEIALRFGQIKERSIELLSSEDL